MNIPEPNKDTYTIYTKQNCKFCDKVKTLLMNVTPKMIIVECDEYLQQDKTLFLEEMNKKTRREYKTFPMVFYKGSFIGGYDDAANINFVKECDKIIRVDWHEGPIYQNSYIYEDIYGNIIESTRKIV